MNISGPAAVAKPEMLFYAPGDLTVTNIRRSRLQKLQKEKANIEAQHRKGSQVYPDFRLIMMARLEA